MCEEQDIPQDIIETAKEVVLGLLPTKSKDIYECAYKRFINWCSEKGVHIYTESVLLACFSNLSSSMESSTLWSQYSMVKATLNVKDGVDIAQCMKLRAFLKEQNEGYVPKKSKAFTQQEVDQFLSKAPNDKYLMMKRSIDSILESSRAVSASVSGSVAGTRSIGAYVPSTSRQQWVAVEEPVRQNPSVSVSRLSPSAESDMAATRGQNVSVVHLRNTSEPWDTSPTSVFSSSGNSTSRSYNTRSSIPGLTKHQSLGNASAPKWDKIGFHSGGEVNSTEIFLAASCNRELSPVRWCDREVDGVYLGRSGWVQVQQRSLDENRRGHYPKNVSPMETVQSSSSRRTAIKLANYHCNSEPGKYSDVTRSLEPQRPVYLPIKGKEFERPNKTPSPSVPVPDSYSPPSVTPIISPPPAFQDRAGKTMKTRTFFGKTPFLPRSNAIVDSDISPPTSPQSTRNSIPPSLPSASYRKKLTPSLSDQKPRNFPRIPQTKSLEDTTANRRTQFLQKYGESSSSSSSSMGFRSLDSYVPKPSMPRLSENTDSSIDVYEDADDEDNNSSSLNLSIVSVQLNTPTESILNRNREKISPTNRNIRLPHHRPQSRRSPCGSDTNKQPACSSPSSSSSSNELPIRSPQGTAQLVRRTGPRVYQASKLDQNDLSMQRVRRSRSLQLPEKNSAFGQREGNLHSRLSPQHQEQRLVVKVGTPERNSKKHPEQIKPLSLDGIELLDEDIIREAEVVTGFLYGNRSRAAAQALLMHRYNNAKEEKSKEFVKPSVNNGFNVFYVGNSSNERQKLHRGSAAPNLNNSKHGFSSDQLEIKNSCKSEACDYWQHYSQRVPVNSQTQSMMKVSHTYPSHQRSLEKPTSIDNSRSNNEDKYKTRLLRTDPESRSSAYSLSASQASISFHGSLPHGARKTTAQANNSIEFTEDIKQERYASPNKDNIGSFKNEISADKKTSPVYPKNVLPRALTATFGNPSNSSSSSDMYVTTSDRTITKSPKTVKSSGTSTPIDEQPTCRDVMPREEILTRPGSAPGEDNKLSSVDPQQRSMSLPKSFLSAKYSGQVPWRKRGTESLGSSPGMQRRPKEAAHTAPVTPLHETTRRRSPLGGTTRRVKASSTPLLLDLSEVENRKWTETAIGKLDHPSRPTHSIQKESALSRRNLSGQSAESVLQKFRKTLSLRFQKKGSKESCSLDIGNTLSEILTEPLEELASAQTDKKEEQVEQKCRFGPLIWRSSKERKKINKAARNAKCNSGDSGIQLEMVPGSSGVGGDSSESHDTDPPADDLDSSPTFRRHPANVHTKTTRPHSDLLNNVLVDKFKNELKSLANKHQHVRRTHSDLGGQRLLHWDSRVALRLMMASSISQRDRSQGKRMPTSDLAGGVYLRGPHRRHQLRRSLSQPLDIDKLSPLIRPKVPGLKSGSTVLSEDEHDLREGTSEDEMFSDSESSFSSVHGRKKSLELRLDEDVTILAEAVFDHVAMESEELGFRAGDVVEVLETVNRDWWWGSTAGKSGWFPAAFVRLRVSQEDTVEDCLEAMASGRTPPSHLRRRTSVSLLSNDQVRTSVVRELVHTERDFVKVLQDVAEGYLAECEKRKDMFTKEQIDTIFINLRDILKFQLAFLRDLETNIDWDAPHKSCVGNCFMQHKEGFTMYSDYCNSHAMATATLQELYQYSNYSKFFEACRLMRGLIEIPLDGYLLTPVQRICKYPLQLAELLKYTKPGHPDYRHIKEALDTMRGVAVLINERKRRMESLEKLAAWQQRVEGWEGEDLIESSSQLIYQGEVDRVTTGMWTSSVMLFLFDNKLVYCKKDILKRNTYIYKGRLHTETTEVIDLPDGKDLHSGVTVRHAIKLHSVISDKWLLFCCRSSSDKQKWLQAFTEERKIVAQDKSDGLKFHAAAKQLARVAAKCQKRPPRKLRGEKNYKWDAPYMKSTLQLNPQNSNSLGRKVGTWFTFGGNKKSRHQNRDLS